MTHAGPTHDALVRTTVTIDDELYEAVRLQAYVERRTLGAVINELLARGLEHRPSRRTGPGREPHARQC